jgi:hypothetical protein
MANVGSQDRTSVRYAIDQLYPALWEAVDNDPWASAAIKRALAGADYGWPPSIDDIASTLASLIGEPTSLSDLAAVAGDADTPLQGLLNMVDDIGVLYARRTRNALGERGRLERARAASRSASSVESVIGVWPQGVDADCNDDGEEDDTNVDVDRNTNDALYMVLAERDGDDYRAHLVALSRDGTHARLIGSIGSTRGFMGDPDALPSAARPYEIAIPPFLESVGRPPVEGNERDPAAYAVRRNMRRLVSWADLPPAAFEATHPRPSLSAISFEGAPRAWVGWLDACALTNVLAQIAASNGADYIGWLDIGVGQPTTLRGLAEQAIMGAAGARFDPSVLPDELSGPLAFGLWQSTCMSEAPQRDPAGNLVGADRLLDVARLWGVEPTETERTRPDLLCASLAPVAISRGAQYRYGRPSLPAPQRLAPLFGPPLLRDDERQAWADACAGIRGPESDRADLDEIVDEVYDDLMRGFGATAWERWWPARDRVAEIVRAADAYQEGAHGPSPIDKARLALMAIRYGLAIEAGDLVTFEGACAALAPLAILWP